MSIALDQALKDVELESGRTYRCRVGDVDVELRVLPAGPLDLTADAMLDPWVEFPHPEPATLIRVEPGLLQMPDFPLIPVGDEMT